MESFRQLEIAQEKLRIWHEAETRVAALRDGLGRTVDHAIRDVLVACMVNGLPTRQSCGGHIASEEPDEGWAFPWICFEANRPENRLVGEADLRRRISQAYGVSTRLMEDIPEAANAFYDAVDQLDFVETEEFWEWSVRQEKVRRVVQRVIDEVYQTHPRSTVSLVMRHGRLEVSLPRDGGRHDSPKTPEALAAHIREARMIFDEFGEILKNRFFEGE